MHQSKKDSKQCPYAKHEVLCPKILYLIQRRATVLGYLFVKVARKGSLTALYKLPSTLVNYLLRDFLDKEKIERRMKACIDECINTQQATIKERGYLNYTSVVDRFREALTNLVQNIAKRQQPSEWCATIKKITKVLDSSEKDKKREKEEVALPPLYT